MIRGSVEEERMCSVCPREHVCARVADVGIRRARWQLRQKEKAWWLGACGI